MWQKCSVDCVCSTDGGTASKRAVQCRDSNSDVPVTDKHWLVSTCAPAVSCLIVLDQSAALYYRADQFIIVISEATWCRGKRQGGRSFVLCSRTTWCLWTSTECYYWSVQSLHLDNAVTLWRCTCGHWLQSYEKKINFRDPFSKKCASQLPVSITSFHPRNTSVISRLRSSTPLPGPTSRTKKFESFVNFALSKYQSPL